MPKYQVAAGVITTPGEDYYQGSEVTAEGMGIPGDRFDHLVSQGAIVEVKEEAPGAMALPAVPPKPPAIPNEPPANDTKLGPVAVTGANDAAPDELAVAVGDKEIAEKLRAAGFATREAIREASDEQLRAVGGIGDGRLKRLRDYAAG